MSIRKALDDVLTLYRLAQQDQFKGNEIAEVLRSGFPDEVRSAISLISENSGIDYEVEGSPGRGQWNFCPWVAIFDPIVTESAQSGYYPVYLFCEDMRGAYLSLNQGVTDVREQYKSKRKAALMAHAADFRSRLGSMANNFPEIKIDLASTSKGNLSADYEAGNIVAKYYPVDNLPEEDAIRSDLLEILRLYEQLTYSTSSDGIRGLDPEDQDCTFIEDYAAFRYHRRIERSPSLAKAVKKARGYKCEACGGNLAKLYPGIKNSKYVEAHHLAPISSLKGLKVSRNPKTDFAVLCANCHRMIHRFNAPGDLKAFRETIAPAFIRALSLKKS